MIFLRMEPLCESISGISGLLRAQMMNQVMNQHHLHGWFHLKLTHIHGKDSDWGDERCNAKLLILILFYYIKSCDTVWMYLISFGIATFIISKWNVESMWKGEHVCWLMLAMLKMYIINVSAKSKEMRFLTLSISLHYYMNRLSN